MYLVELSPGKEELYRSSDELALAIRNGDVDARSRIYHRATAKWISITLHPQYKAIVTMAKEEPAARPARKGWTFLGGINPVPEPAPEPTDSSGHLLHHWRRPLALGISGVLLMLGVQLAFSGPRPPWSGRGRVVATKTPHPAPAVTREPAERQEIVSLASTTTVWPAEEPRSEVIPAELISSALARPTDSIAVAPVPVVARRLPRAPRLRPKSLSAALETATPKEVDGKTVEAMLGRYAGAHDAARERLENGMRVARLGRLFAAPRLNPNGGVTDTRMSLAGAANFIRVYRQQQAAIEVAYQDSVMIFARKFGWSPSQVKQWYSREIRTEDPALTVLSGSLLAGIDSVLGVLDAQAGAYKIRGTAIAFEDPTAALKYGALRRRIKEQVDSAVAAGGATSAGPTGLLLRAIGRTILPRET
jgi:hypothetical protein